MRSSTLQAKVQDDHVEINPPASLQDSLKQLSFPSQRPRHDFLSTALVFVKDNIGEYTIGVVELSLTVGPSQFCI